MPRKDFEGHTHDAMVHNHEHLHVTHYLHAGARGTLEHLLANHRHEHNHAAVTHAHLPHEDEAREHRREAHIHDHAHPAQS